MSASRARRSATISSARRASSPLREGGSMAIADQSVTPSGIEAAANMRDAYKHWMDAQRIPIHRGYFIDDVRTVEVGTWDERGCSACFLELAGQQGVSESRITEIAPGATTEPVRFNLDEMVYVADGRGLTTVWAEGQPKKTFEWQKHSMFLLPRGYNYQLSN